MASGFLNHLLLICLFELRRLFSTRKGLLYLITFTVVWYFILIYPIRFASEMLENKINSNQGSHFFEFIGFDSLLNWQIPEFGLYWHVALLLFPILSILTCSDQTCSDRERGTLRFLILRMSRDSLFFGRFTGMMVIHTLLITITLLSTLAIAIYRDSNVIPTAFTSMAIILVNLNIVLLPFTAMMAVLSATVETPRQATVWAVLIWSFLAGIINLLSSYLPALDSLKMLVPGYQMSQLSQLSEWQTLQLAYIPIIQTIALLSLGRWIMLRQSL